jgi:hypothetical protein
MKRLIWVLAFLCFNPWSRAAAQHVQNEGLVRTLGPEWKSMYQITRDLTYDAIVLVRNGDTITDWREIVQIADCAYRKVRLLLQCFSKAVTMLHTLYW